MKEVYNYRCLVSFDGGKEFHDTSIWNHMRYLEEKDAQEWQSKELTFDECYEMCENGFLMNGEAWVGMFKKEKLQSAQQNGNVREHTTKKIIVRLSLKKCI